LYTIVGLVFPSACIAGDVCSDRGFVWTMIP
jgi:hypothetical protein